MDRDVHLKLQALYDKMPDIDCQGLCGNSCGPIDMSAAEHDRIVELGVLIPTFSAEAAQRWANQEPLHCPALNRQTAKCDVYEARPLICRAWGVSASMPCTYGCKPSRYLTDKEMYHLLLESFEIGGNRHGSNNQELQAMLDLLEDPEVEALMARFIRGDRTVEFALGQAIDRHRAARGL